MPHNRGQNRGEYAVWLTVAETVIVISAIGIGCWLLLAIAIYETTIPYLHDVPIFMAVGRALLNGRELYSEVFETKPPAIFLVAAASIALSDQLPHLIDSTALFRLLQLGAYVGILAASLLLSRRGNVEDGTRTHRFLFGVVMVYTVAVLAGQGTPESFGAAFAALYVAAVTRLGDRARWPSSIGLGILLAASIGFKEPFAVSLLAAGLICCRGRDSMTRHLVVPLLLAATVGVGALGLLGWLDDYFREYLPYMFSERVPSHMQKSLWQQLLDVEWVMKSLSLLSPALPALVVCLAIGAIQMRGRPKVTVYRFLVVALSAVMGMAAIRIGGAFRAQYIIFAVPILFALEAELLRISAASGGRRIDKIVMACLIAVVFTIPFGRHADRAADILKIGPSTVRDRLADEDRLARRDAFVLDKLMDACGYSTATVLRPVNSFFYGYTKHSPAGRDYQWQSPHMNDAIDGAATAILASLEATPLVVFDRDERGLRMFVDVERFVAVNFTETPPACASGVVPADVKVMFRDDPSPVQVARRLKSLGDRYLSEGRKHDALSAFLEAGEFAGAEGIADGFVSEGRLAAAIEVYGQTGDYQRLREIGEGCLRDGCYEEALDAFSRAGDAQRLLNLAALLESLGEENANRLAEDARIAAQHARRR